MTEEKGLVQILPRLSLEQARILAAHERLKSDLASINCLNSGRWENRETAIAVLEALDQYLSATLDNEQKFGDISIVCQSDQRAVLPDIILHLQSTKWGNEDPRLAVNRSLAGAAHDKATVKFKEEAVALVNGISKELAAAGVKNHKAEARRQVVQEYQRLGLKFQACASSQLEDIDATMLASWEKDQKRRNRPGVVT